MASTFTSKHDCSKTVIEACMMAGQFYMLRCLVLLFYKKSGQPVIPMQHVLILTDTCSCSLTPKVHMPYSPTPPNTTTPIPPISPSLSLIVVIHLLNTVYTPVYVWGDINLSWNDVGQQDFAFVDSAIYRRDLYMSKFFPLTTQNWFFFSGPDWVYVCFWDWPLFCECNECINKFHWKMG